MKEQPFFTDSCRHGYSIYMHKLYTIGRVCHHAGNPTILANREHLQEGDLLPWVDMFEMKPEDNKDSYTIESVRLRTAVHLCYHA